jgi:hypothetical protein
MSLKRTTLMSVAAALLFSAGAAFAEEPDTVAVEPGAGEEQPEVIYHKIVPRDTLWDISEYYLKDPFKWPNVWKINPFIANPDLIYPGDTVRLTPGGVVVMAPDDLKAAEGLEKVGLEPEDGALVLEPEPGAEPEKAPTPPAPKAPVVRDHAMARSGFVTETEFQASGAIIGPKERKILMNNGDDVFVSFKEKEGIKQGSRYTVYNVGRQIKHPDTGRPVGYEIDILGSLTMTRAHDDVVEALIDNSFKEIPLGARVRPYSEPVREVEVTRPGSEVAGVIVMALEGKENLSAGDIAYLDKGSSDGLMKGNLMRIYRVVPDAPDPMERGKKVSLPPLELGTLVVLEAGEGTSSAVVVKSVRPINWGDHVSTSSN